MSSRETQRLSLAELLVVAVGNTPPVGVDSARAGLSLDVHHVRHRILAVVLDVLLDDGAAEDLDVPVLVATGRDAGDDDTGDEQDDARPPLDVGLGVNRRASCLVVVDRPVVDVDELETGPVQEHAGADDDQRPADVLACAQGAAARDGAVVRHWGLLG